MLAEDDNPLDVLDVQRLVTALKLTVVPFTEADWVASVNVYHARRRTGEPDSARFGECMTAAVAARTGTEVVGGFGTTRDE